MRLKDLSKPIIRETADVDLPPILDVLLASKIPFTVIGAFATNCYSSRPRHSQDIDVLAKEPGKLAAYVAQVRPDLQLTKSKVVFRFSENGKEILDILAANNPIFVHAITDTQTHGQITVPSPEALVAMKFLAIMAPERQQLSRAQDKVDMFMIISNHNVSIDKVKKYLSDLYDRAGEDFENFLKKEKEEEELFNRLTKNWK